VSTGVLALCLRASRSPPPLVTCLAEKHSPEGQHDRGAARVEALRGPPSASARRAVIEFGLGWGSRSAHRQAAWDPCSRTPPPLGPPLVLRNAVEFLGVSPKSAKRIGGKLGAARLFACRLA